MDYSSVGTIFLFIVLIIIALVVALKLLSTGEDQITTRQINSTPVPMDEGKFLIAFLKPVYDDGLEEMETAVDAIRDGLDFYGRGAFVNAGEQFIDAGRSIDAAIAKFREVLTLVEDPEVKYAKDARDRLRDCKRFQDLAKDMESACDAMLDDNAAEAGALEEKVKDIKKFAEEWQKE
jgi:hypothetical protein